MLEEQHLVALLVKIAVAASVASILMRFRTTQRILLNDDRTLRGRLQLALTTYSGTIAIRPPTIRVVTRNGSDGIGHHLEGVDLLGDPHRAELGGEAAADRRGQRDAGDERRDLAGVEVRRDEARRRPPVPIWLSAA